MFGEHPPEPPPMTRLEMLAYAADVWPEQLRDYLRRAVDEGSRARARKHARAHAQIDAKAGIG